MRSIAKIGILAIALTACDGPTIPEPTEIPAAQMPVGLSLAFVSHSGGTPDIYVMESGGVRRLTNDGRVEENLQWSPDGEWIAFRTENELWIVGADGTGLTRVVQGAFDIAWSPDSRKLAYSRGGFESGSLHVVNVDGTDNRMIASGTTAGHATWSPDGTRIAMLLRHFFGPIPNQADVYVVNVDGTGLTDVSNTRDIAEDLPRWAPDGSKIAYTGDLRLSTMNPDGSDQQVFAFAQDDYQNLAWSPDSRRLAWISGQCCTAPPQLDVHVMNVDGTGHKRVTTLGSARQAISWSPNGERLAFATDSRVYIVKPDGTALGRVGAGEIKEHSPVWRP